MKSKIKAIEEYLKYYPNDYNAKNNLKLCRYADELGIELKGGFYPRMDNGWLAVNGQMRVGKNYCLTNTKTDYKFNGKDTIIIWTESSGRLAFVDTKYWWDVNDEWEEFMEVLKSYKPLDYDDINDEYIYDLENGKRLIDDYEKILKGFLEKVNKKIDKVKREEKKKQLEMLKVELGEN